MERYIPTQAMHITNDTYPIAVAMLPGGFAAHPTDKVIGNVLVINEIRAVRTKDRGVLAALGNAHMTKEDFDAMYTAYPEENVGLFFKVVRKD